MTAPAYDIRFSSNYNVYRVREEITCTAQGYPAPRVHWEQVRSNGAGVESSVRGPVLRITDDMVGNNTWRCRAVNTIGSAERMIAFLVVGM